MNTKEFDLSVSNFNTIRKFSYDIILLPWGATEPHNLHLPYMTDSILSHAISVDASKEAFKRYGIRCMVMPPINMGAQNPGQRDISFCIHYNHQTQYAILHDTVSSLYHQGFRKLVLINGHGGNSFKGMIRDLTLEYPEFIILLSDWLGMSTKVDIFEEPENHAGELETSVMMYYYPELVNLDEAGNGESVGFSIDALKKGKVWTPRNWKLVSKDTGIGNPAKSTREKGRLFANDCVNNYADFFKELTMVKSSKDLYEK